MAELIYSVKSVFQDYLYNGQLYNIPEYQRGYKWTEQQVEQLKAHVEQLEKQLEYVKANEAWLKQQLDQKLIEHKNHEKKGLLGRLFG